MEYNFREIEKSGLNFGLRINYTEQLRIPQRKSIMFWICFPIHQGLGLHVGHPLGYIASDVIARYKKLSGFNVLHPMGYDSFGLPAEQYAIQTGQHPAITTNRNIDR